jgi:hypothetical protein
VVQDSAVHHLAEAYAAACRPSHQSKVGRCRCERRAGADAPRRASTTLDIYQQFVPESQMRVVERLSSLSKLVN